VLFIDASREFAREQSQSFLRSSHQVRILDAYRAFADGEGFATVATIDEIGAHSYSLAIPLYVASPHESANTEPINVIEALADWRAAATASDAAIHDVIALFRREVSA
jgi:type I restriction enzyme M protein